MNVKASLIFAALTMVSPAFAAKAPNWKQVSREATALLTDFILLDTSNPPGNESLMARRIAQALDKESIPYEIFESSPGRANLVARLRGTGKARPLLLVAHTDTVGATEESWSTDPFKATTGNGYLTGRGAIDDKGLLTTQLMVFISLKRLQVPLARDVIFLAAADEESGGANGMRWLIANHWNMIDAEYAFNEGGYAVLDDESVTQVGIQCSEKAYHDILLSVVSKSGHSAVPNSNNPIAILAQTVSKIAFRTYPIELDAVTQQYFKAIGARPGDFPIGAKEYAMARNTIVPTMIEAGSRNNVTPSRATVNLNARLLPGSDINAFMESLRRVINDPRVTTELDISQDMPKSIASPMDSLAYKTLSAAAEKVFPDSLVVPYLSPGATDSIYLRAKGVKAYGIGLPLTREDTKRIHGADERVPLRGLEMTTQFLWEAVLALAGQPGK
ncbi:MAG: M20/M25/M40 family metallo-hydrolase [Elusimicrobiota bacterium]